MLLTEINRYLEKSGYELYYENTESIDKKSVHSVLMKRRIEDSRCGICTGLEEFMIDTLQSEPPDELARRVLGLVKSELGAERV